MLITSSSAAGFGSIYSTRCTLLVPMLFQSFSFLRSVGSEKRLPEVGMGSICIGHKTGRGGLSGLGFYI